MLSASPEHGGALHTRRPAAASSLVWFSPTVMVCGGGDCEGNVGCVMAFFFFLRDGDAVYCWF